MNDEWTRCPYQPCGFEGTRDAVDDHVAYLQRIGDDDHDVTCLWGADSGAECGRRRRREGVPDRACPLHDHASLPAFMKRLYGR